VRKLGVFCAVLHSLAACGDDDDNLTCEDLGTCEQPDPCEPDPCDNGGSCTAAGTAFTCACAPGFDGRTCDTNINECATHQCVSGATCVDGVNGYTCACANGFSGALCESDIDECAASPCSPNASCTNTAGSYTCQCTGDYVGDGVTCTSTLIGEWRLDGDAVDSSANDYDGTIDDATDTTGWTRGALNLTTASESAVLIPYIDLRSTSFTVQTWVRSVIGTDLPIFTQCESATADHCLRLERRPV
jgi:hypothetical protein